MNTTIRDFLSGLVVGVVVVLIVVGLVGNLSGNKLGSYVVNDLGLFTAGIKVGNNGQTGLAPTSETINSLTNYVSAGSLANGTTTILSLVNPFGKTATSTVILVRLFNTPKGVATTSYAINCGASSGSATPPSYNILTSGLIATSSNFDVLQNNLTTSNGATISGGSVAKILITNAYPYLICMATSSSGSDYNTAFSNVNNTFDGTYKVKWQQ